MKNEKGITLIALIITIIVMLILAIVSIKVASDSGLFSKAETGTKQTKEQALKEEFQSALVGAYDIDNGYTLENLKSAFGESNVIQSGTNFSIAYKENNFVVTPDGNIISSNAGSSEGTPQIQEGDTVLFSYDGTEANKKEWTVIHKYEDSYEIVSPEVIGSLTLGYEDATAQNPGDVDNNGTANENIDKAIYSYNNAITRINDYCESLITNENSNILSVRSIGSNPEAASDTNEFFANQYKPRYSGIIEKQDDNYSYDNSAYNQNDEILGEYFVCSRKYSNVFGNNDYFSIRYQPESPYADANCLIHLPSEGLAHSYSVTMGVRPIVRMSL